MRMPHDCCADDIVALTPGACPSYEEQLDPVGCGFEMLLRLSALLQRNHFCCHQPSRWINPQQRMPWADLRRHREWLLSTAAQPLCCHCLSIAWQLVGSLQQVSLPSRVQRNLFCTVEHGRSLHRTARSCALQDLECHLKRPLLVTCQTCDVAVC